MDQFLKSLPQWMVAILILIVGVIFFYIAMPPKSRCDAQVEIFKKSETPFLFVDPKKSYAKKTVFMSSIEDCKLANSHGGCNVFFEGLNNLVINMKTIPNECLSTLADIDVIRPALTGSLKLMAKLAWGDKAPTVYEKQGWLDSFHLKTFCSLRSSLERVYGTESWAELVNTTMAEFPQANQLDRNEVWARTILSTNCAAFN